MIRGCKIAIIIFVFCVFISVYAYCENKKEEIPEWVKRIEISTQLETDKQPTFYFQTVQPFYQSLDKVDTIFCQPRIHLRSGRTTYNLGIGYRKILQDRLLLGINLFGDYQDLHEHGRLGLGLEALGNILEGRFNSYFGVSSKRKVEDNLTSTTYEKAVDGVDYELGLPIPYLPWLKFYASGFWYDYKKASDREGWKSRLEAKLNECITLEFYTWDDNKGEQEYGGRLRFYMAFDQVNDFKKAFTLSKEPFPKKDLKKQTLAPVERNFDIVTEKWIESGTMTISVGRNN